MKRQQGHRRVPKGLEPYNEQRAQGDLEDEVSAALVRVLGGEDATAVGADLGWSTDMADSAARCAKILADELEKSPTFDEIDQAARDLYGPRLGGISICEAYDRAARLATERRAH
jgi:hypothetical protein